MVSTIIVSPKNQTVFFTEYEDLPTTKSGPSMVVPRLYCWTETGGFKAMNATGIGTSSPQLSADETVFIEGNYGVSGPSGTVIYDIKAKTTTPFKNRTLNIAAYVSADTALTIERKRTSTDDAYGQLTRVDCNTGKSEQVLPGQLAGRVTSFDGAIWVLLKNSDGSYQVARLSSNLDRIEETVNVK